MVEKQKIEDVINIVEYVGFVRRRYISSYYAPYLSWGIYLLLNSILNIFGYYEGWIWLWLPAAFFSSLSYTRLSTALKSWIIAGVVFYFLVILFKWWGFYVGIPLACLLGFGLLPGIFDKKKESKKDFWGETFGMLIFVILISSIMFLAVLMKVLDGRYFMLGYPWFVMIITFYGLSWAFLRAGIFFVLWIVLTACFIFVIVYNPQLWYILSIAAGISGICIGIYGVNLKRRQKQEV